MTAKRSRLPEATRTDHVRSIQTGMILSKLEAHLRDEIELKPTQLKAAELLLARTLPTLAAVEHTQINEMDKLTEAQIMDKIANMIESNPGLATVLQSLSRRQSVLVAEVAPVLGGEVGYSHVPYQAIGDGNGGGELGGPDGEE